MMTIKEMELALAVKELRLELEAVQANRDEWKAEALKLRAERQATAGR